MDVPKENQQFGPTYISNNAEDIVRPTADFSPSVWGDYFISNSPESPLTAQKASACTEQKLEELKKEVKAMFRSTDDLGKSLRLIDDLQRLGLSYQFEEEISGALRSIHYHNDDIEDLGLVALRFRLLRQQGYNASSDVFRKFKDNEGKFKQELSGDVKGLLHLYEATWLGTHEDEILDEAHEFARGHMERKLENAEEEHSTQLRHALDVPLRRRLRRLQAREYISMYEKETANNNLLLLELAKLDFNRLQLLHQAEIKIISMWWKELGLAKKLSFIKDRVPESYFWSLGISFEPQYSCGRVLLAKLIVIWSVLDDMYDAYGTLEELQLLTDLISRWDLHDVHRLPGYMRTFLTCFSSFIREIEDELTPKGSVHHIHYIIKMFKGITAAYFKEAEWANKRFTPTLQEYLRNGLMSGGLPMTCFALSFMGEATQDTLDWVVSTPEIVEASAIIGRLLNDICTSKFEQERMHVTSALQCSMNDTGATELGATSKLKEMVANAWKDINRQSLDTLQSRKHVHVLALSCAHVVEFLYRHEDIFTNPAGKMKETIALLLVNPIQD